MSWNKLSIEELDKRAKKAHLEGNYKYDWNKYTGMNNLMPIWCENCQEWFQQRPADHLRGLGCRKCGAKKTAQKLKISLEEFKERSEKLNPDKFDYSLVKEFENNREKIEIICKTCGKTFKTTAHNHLRGYGCPYCRGLNKTNQRIIEEIIKANGDTLDCSEIVYKGAHKKVKITCKNCKTVFWATPHHLINGHSCPNCKTSRGEKFIKLWLERNNINYMCQKTFDGCRDKNLLRFDFYLPDLRLCIEFQGAQHYKPNFFINKLGEKDGLEKFEQLRYHDQIKRNYCNTNNIKLVEITYKDDIEEKLKDLLF